MTIDDLKKLDTGDIVRSTQGNIFIVTYNYGGRVTATMTADITNPIEWDIISKVKTRGPIK